MFAKTKTYVKNSKTRKCQIKRFRKDALNKDFMISNTIGGMMHMATKSFLNMIVIDEEQTGTSFVDALEKSTNQHKHNTESKIKYSEIKKDMISDFL